MTTKDIPGWFSKILLGIIGVLLTAVGAWVAKAADRQATALEELKAAVYSGQTRAAVLETKVDGIETRVKRLEARVYKEQ